MTSLLPPSVTLLDKYHGNEFKPLYVTSVTVTGGETGHGRASGFARAEDGNLAVDLRLPRELGGSGDGTNPEQLFAAGYAACFHGVLHLLASKARVAIPNAKVKVTVAFGRDPVDGLYMLTADVQVFLPDIERILADELVRNAERVCPYAKMARQGIAGITVAVQ
ncbi:MULTISPECIES: Ohr family peroxiredoxin [unclassified Cupriavidus]|uniref:Ohr family peroxiredoxin n=1 Tax=Cupriavidus sp. H19C3 TaxID=3241603 RepID=UPI003BF8C6A8